MSGASFVGSLRRPIQDLIATARARQWVKNVFVLVPLFFGETGFSASKVIDSLVATGIFCLLSSSVYVLNDVIDRDKDRAHPRKCRRPIAAGRIGVGSAVGLLAGLYLLAVAAGAILLTPRFLLLCHCYAINSMAYCLWLKSKVVLDVIVISIGFVIRLLAGCAAIEVVPSSWLVVCGFCLALVLGFGKRRTEVETLAETREHRPVLLSYDRAKCDTLLAISTAVCLVSYIAYTVAPETVAIHRTRNLVYSTPLVAYGLFRYILKTQEGRGGDGPTEILTGDWVFAATGLLWVSSVLVILSVR